MNILVHDYSGHPFQVQLSRALAARGHDVLHLYSSSFQTPKATLDLRSNDPPTLSVEGLDLDEPFDKYRFVHRFRQERRYGSLLAARIAAARPDVVLSANCPLDAQAIALRASHKIGAPFVFWIQDLYSTAIDRFLSERLPVVGHILAKRFVHLEADLLRQSDAVVAITQDFLPALRRWNVRQDRISVIENWAPLDEIEPSLKDNSWSREHGLSDLRVLMYSGSLGLKHGPELLLDLAAAFLHQEDVRVVVISEGIGADWLRERASNHPNLVLLPFQPFARMSEVLGTADVAVAILEAGAGSFSVPSKILTYLAAGRPILASMPDANLGARTILRARAGIVVPPGDAQALVAGAESLVGDVRARSLAGESARDYAVKQFDIGRISQQFDTILCDVVRTSSKPDGAAIAGRSDAR